MFIELELDWMSHPFSLNRFKIRSQTQIDTIRSLGLQQVRYDPARSDTLPLSEEKVEPVAVDTPEMIQARELAAEEIAQKKLAHKKEHEQQASLQECEKHYNDACRQLRVLTKEVFSQPQQAKQKVDALASSLIQELMDDNVAIRLLADRSGDEFTLHSVNVTVLSLLLGKNAGLEEAALHALTVGSLLHDIGKLSLPDRLRFQNTQLSSAEKSLLKEHVAKGVEIGREMELPPHVLLAIGQHHELADGNGYPSGINVHRMTVAARIISLINRYDNLCNNANPLDMLTPHEALRTIFAQTRHEFDETLLASFVKMMGIYPPGSVVKLTDDRFGIVTSVNPNKPLKPTILAYEPKVAREHAPVINLEHVNDLGIKQSIKPVQLPKAVFDYLAPRKQLSYFFEHTNRSLVMGEHG